MTNKNHDKKEFNEEQEIKIIGEIRPEEEALKFEQALKKDRLAPIKDAGSGGVIKKAGEKISLVLVFALLLLSIVQSIELFSLRNQIIKGQFTTAGAAAPSAGGSQALPAQQGGC